MTAIDGPACQAENGGDNLVNVSYTHLDVYKRQHIASSREKLDPDFLPNIVKVWQSYDNLGSKADRDELSNEVMFGGKQVALDEFAPNRAVVGNPDDCIRELERIRDIINPEWLFITPTGVPDTDQQAEELRLFAKEVMPHFRSE